jgi:hypothetical protein
MPVDVLCQTTIIARLRKDNADTKRPASQGRRYNGKGPEKSPKRVDFLDNGWAWSRLICRAWDKLGGDGGGFG